MSRNTTEFLPVQAQIQALKQYCSVADRAINRSALVLEGGLLTQQRLGAAESRINHLLAQLKHNNPSSVERNRLSQVNQPVTVPSDLPLIQQLRQQLVRRSELLRQSAHDLKGNFSLISWVNDMLQNELTHEDQQEMLGMLHRNVQLATQLIPNCWM